MAQQRLDYIDNLRWTMIVLVLGVHAAVSYSHIGMWYYVEQRPVDQLSTMIFLTFECFTQAFFMGFLFLLAGCFTPSAYDRKGFWRFLWDRFVRLGIPSILYAFLLHPIAAYYGSGWYLKEAPLGALHRYFAESMWLDGSGPMWFALALLVFSVFYGLIRALAPKPKEAAPVKVTLAVVIAIGLIITAIAYAIRTTWWIGTHFHTYQLCFFAQYVVLFVAGILAFRRKAFDGISKRLGYPLLAAGVVLGPVTFWVLLIGGGLFQNGFGQFEGHGTLLSAGYALWESMTCVAVSAGLLVLYRERFNIKGRIAKLMSANAFAIYVVHPPIMVGITLALAAITLPPLAKWGIVWPAALVATLLVAMALRLVPLLKKILA